MQAKILRENWRASGKKQFERMCAFNLAQLIGLAENHGHPKLLKEFSGSYLSITLSLKSMFLLQSASRFKLDQPKNNAQSKREKRGGKSSKQPRRAPCFVSYGDFQQYLYEVPIISIGKPLSTS